MLTPLAKPSTEVHRSQSLTLFKTGGGVVEHLKLFRLTSFYLQSYTRVAIRQFCQRQSRKTMLFWNVTPPAWLGLRAERYKMQWWITSERKWLIISCHLFPQDLLMWVSVYCIFLMMYSRTRAKQMYSSIKVKKIKAMIDQRNLFCWLEIFLHTQNMFFFLISFIDHRYFNNKCLEWKWNALNFGVW